MRNKHVYPLFQREILSLSSKVVQGINILINDNQKKDKALLARYAVTEEIHEEGLLNYNIYRLLYVSPNVNSLRDFISSQMSSIGMKII